MGSKIDNSVKTPLVHHNSNHTTKHTAAKTDVTPTKTNGTSQHFNASVMSFNAGVLKTKLNANVTAQAATNGIDRDKIDFLKKNLQDAGHLAIAISSPDFNKDLKPNPAERNKLIGEIIRSKDAERLLLDYGLPQSPRNITYDQQKTVAGAVGEAYKAGEVSDADLKDLAKRLGPEKTANLIMTLASDPNNTKPGGVVEALGKQAKDLGYKQAAALAFTSSDALIKNNLPNAADRKAAFNEVKAFIDAGKDNAKYNAEAGAQYNSQFALAVGNAARLTATGDGYSQSEFDNLLKDLGPRLTNEIIARSTSVEGDGRAGGALDVLGQSSERIAANSKDDDKRRWEVNTAVAYTSSPELIAKHLNTPEKRMQAFDTLNKELYRQRDNVKDSVKNGFSLLGQPAAANGLANLLATNGKEILDAKIGENGTNYKGQADLIQFLQSTLYSPNTTPELANKLKGVMQNYVNQTFSDGQQGNTRAGERIGALLGLHDVAFQRAYSEASTPEAKSKLEKIEQDIVKTVIKESAKGLLKSTGPIGALAGGFVLDQVLNEIFKDRTPSAGQLGEEFLKLLKEKGLNVDDATNYKDNLIAVIDTIRDGIRAKMDDPNISQKDKDNLQNALAILTEMEEKFRTRNLETYNEYDKNNGKLREELKNWKP